MFQRIRVKSKMWHLLYVNQSLVSIFSMHECDSYDGVMWQNDNRRCKNSFLKNSKTCRAWGFCAVVAVENRSLNRTRQRLAVSMVLCSLSIIQLLGKQPRRLEPDWEMYLGPGWNEKIKIKKNIIKYNIKIWEQPSLPFSLPRWFCSREPVG